MNMIPPITPPAIGPAGDDLLPESPDSPLTFSHRVVGHVLQPPPIREQTSPEAHTGHGGGSGGQLAQRLKSVGCERLASITMSIILAYYQRKSLTKVTETAEIHVH